MVMEEVFPSILTIIEEFGGVNMCEHVLYHTIPE